MNDITAYEKILRDRQRELQSRLSRIDDDLGRTKEQDSDDRATESENDEVLEGLGQAGQEELRAIGAALERIDKGTYGLCVHCGQPISSKRLEAVPYAPLCEDCMGR
ncbi:TraR/DksA family transcriptional regulator [Rhizobium grahamii]|uniref:TraR/DksA family transcriptional regulator n=1 Tax=Rhizobium grahamii TaxID=1120045 RepID=A0A5Q0C6C4_9HYPH|nr:MULTISPECIES: TraR/DksA family transcriptional regulator [Rhizobium]QFY59461.1 TraR/DksA family transcriptional regulator [Rhizobium grahamii]QRM48013.1 TraR/DksA family transcriptional regulator [Rhizobium sp. BG6]